MSYPDWVMKHKTKGMYVNKVNDETYRLYRGHSQRVPGTNTVKRIVDEYIGTITKSEGLKKTQPKIKGPVQVLRYGRSCLLSQLMAQYIRHLQQVAGSKWETAYVWGLLLSQYGESAGTWYRHDWLSVRYPGLEFTDASLLQEARRMSVMLEDKLKQRFGEDASRMVEFADRIYRVHVNGQWVTSEIEPEAVQAARRYGIVWEG